MKAKRYEGFSLIEILVVVALIIILATITIVAINPGKNFKDTRNAQRSSDVNTILSAVTQYTTDGNALPEGIDDCPEDGSVNQTSIIGTDTGNINLDALLTSEGSGELHDYLVSVPMDPQGGTAGNTKYTICTIGTRVQIAAPGAEGKTIVVKR